ncbi:MAG: hypothetical protein VB071_11470 [Lawsonibacter sp.]|nr:hypothetical protein [Lawsonibacter sp.]
MENGEKLIARMLHKDCILLLACLAAVAATILFTLAQVLPLTDDPALKAVLATVCLTALLVMCGSPLWVLRNLSQHKTSVYSQDLFYLDQMRMQTEDGQQ